MDLLKNPFNILTATPIDNSLKIMELADARSLLIDSNECMQASSDLTNPRKRLSAEIAWLPGLGPNKITETLSLLESNKFHLLDMNAMSSIAKTNLLAAMLYRLSEHTSDNIFELIKEIVYTFENVDPEDLYILINEERNLSDFPEVTDLSAIETEIQERRNYYLKVIKSALDTLSTKELIKIITLVVESSTKKGKEQCPILIDDIVDSYEVEAQAFFEKEEGNIKTLVEKLMKMVDTKLPDSTLIPIVDQLIQVVKNWGTVVKPIQVSRISRGLDHDPSNDIAALIRGLALHFFNEHGKLNFSQQLTSMLQTVFADVPEISEYTAKDLATLGEILEERNRQKEDSKKHAKKWRKEITYEAYVGVFKEKLRISPESIEWKGHRWDLNSITRIRWGETRRSIGRIVSIAIPSIPIETTYNIFFGNRSDYSTVYLMNYDIYGNFIDRLWKAVGIRLLTDYLEGLRNGKEYRFGSILMSDLGMGLERKKLFSSNEQVFCRWNELVIWSDAGVFCIGKKGDKKLLMSLSYQNEDNIHVLEAMLRMFWKRTGDKISSLLDE